MLEISRWMMDAPRSGGPVEVDSDQIETVIENGECYTTWETANALQISKSIVIGENEKCVYSFTKKPEQTFWMTQNK